jgi:hypothetical protein
VAEIQNPKLPPKLPPVASTPPGKTGGEKTSAPPAPTVAGGNQPGQSQTVPAANSGKSSVPLFGGYKGGKKRKDGLKPGSPEAVAADKKRNADRMREARAANRAAVEPAPIPADFPATPTAAGEAAAPVRIAVDFAGVEPVPPPVAWDAKEVKELMGEILPMIEELRIQARLRKLKLANLPPDVAKQIMDDAEKGWPQKARQMVEKNLSVISAKYLNEAGVSPELQPWIGTVGGLLIILSSEVAFHKRMDKVIRAANEPKTEKA